MLILHRLEHFNTSGTQTLNYKRLDASTLACSYRMMHNPHNYIDTESQRPNNQSLKTGSKRNPRSFCVLVTCLAIYDLIKFVDVLNL